MAPPNFEKKYKESPNAVLESRKNPTVKKSLTVQEKPIDKVKTIEEIDNDIHKEIVVKNKVKKNRSSIEQIKKDVDLQDEELNKTGLFNREDFKKEDQDFMLRVWQEKDELLLDIWLLYDRLEKLNDFVETYIQYR